MKNPVRVKTFKYASKLIGQQLPTNAHGAAGRAVEDLLEQMGIPINRGPGTDMMFGLECKTRKLSATSAQTICVMHPSDIVKLSYYNSPVYAKFQQQLRIKTNDNDIIVSAQVYNFDQPHIQDKAEAAYENGRRQIIKDPNILYTPYEGHWGYFENTRPDKTSCLKFRVTDGDMEKLEEMSTSTFNKIFELT
jgi:hypothetical protein